MTSTTMSETERAAYLATLGLPGTGDLGAAPARTEVPVHQPVSVTPLLGPPGVDPRLMAVDDIEFSPDLLDRFPTLGGREPLDYVFSLYKSHGRGEHDSNRNKVLWRKCQTFVSNERLKRKTGGVVAEKVKTSKTERENAQVLANAGIDAETLARLIQVAAALEAQGVDLNSLITTTEA